MDFRVVLQLISGKSQEIYSKKTRLPTEIMDGLLVFISNQISESTVSRPFSNHANRTVQPVLQENNKNIRFSETIDNFFA